MNRPHIVFLDEGSVDFGDINLKPLHQGVYRSYKNSEEHQTIARSKKASIIVSNKVVFNASTLKQLPHLKLICVAATGVNNVDLDAAQKMGIAVCNVAGYSTNAVAEHTLMFLLALSHRLLEHHQASINGQWQKSPYFALVDFPFSELKDKTLGIIGYGNIGKKVAQLAKALGMKVIIGKIPGRKYSSKRLTLTQLVQKSDYISLHCPLSRSSYHLINKKLLQKFKKGSCLLNLGRGPLVNEDDVAYALKKNQIRAYATDVTGIEPPAKSNPLYQKSLKDKVLFTPHIAWGSQEARQRLVNEIGKNIDFFLKGKKRNRVV